MVRLVKQVKELAEAVSVLELEVSQNEQLINRRVDQEIDRVDQIYTNILSIIDSRLDKLEAKITNNKQVLKG